MKAIIEVDVPDYQIGQEASIYFKDTMMIKGIVQEPKTGHWITTRTWRHDGEPYCDKCGADALNEKKTRFCPKCGAKMVETQESEE